MIIGLCGPSAIGKTTAVRRWLARYGRLGLVGVHCDLEAEEWPDGRRRVRGWKGTAGEKGELVAAHRAGAHVAVLESVRTTALNYFMPGEPVVLTLCRAEVMGRALRARCTAKGKRYRDDYWDDRKLAYEGARRYELAAARLRTEDVTVFTIEDQAADWPAVDEHFGALFRRLHNRLVAARSGRGVAR